ncbi:MAG: DUF4350 domain-containing protein [Gemmatales bacterium]
MGHQPQTPAELGSYDPGKSGARAAFLLLKELGLDVAPSKRIVEGKIRWIIAPRSTSRQFEALPAWVQSGGKVLLADDKNEITGKLGITATEKTISDQERQQKIKLGDKEIDFDAGAVELSLNKPADRTWPPQAKKPFVSIFRQGQGEVWLVHLPQFMRNDVLKQSIAAHQSNGLGNGLLIKELAEAMVQNSGERIWFDEYFHGMRARPSVLELLSEPPLLWVSLQGLLLLVLALWRYAPRFGTYQELPTPRRRSKEEYLLAMASMLERKRAYDVALQSVRQSVTHGLAQALSLPAEVQPTILAQQAEAHWPGKLRQVAVLHSLTSTLPRHASETDFLHALHELEAIRHVYATN